ncbi:LysR family transcriptional regulator [Glaciimonas soli]|uniref:LysR family transcriptional regulator n=1 Tax=Glaciimonas soli TaxID=2590999 RepID=A0A843YQG2_9BURK|nr:LysR family transcriptional regulator [Glaciimonas soli]MQR00217.1 LysR family transcriptional regulator [Glaciimonas soli]
MDIGEIDLNFLKAFDAMMRKRHVTQAGAAIGLSQPAMSYALSKMRELFQDPLFVRTARGMEPTPRALELSAPVARVLELVHSEILLARKFMPRASSRTFVLCMSDIGEIVFLPRLLKRLDAEAPHIKIRTVALDTAQLEEGLSSGDVDLAVGYFPTLTGAVMRQKALYRHSFVCIVRKDHPLIGDTLSLEQYLAASHVRVQAEGRTQDIMERAQERLGIEVNVRFNLPRFIGVPFIIADSDMIATVPLAVGRRFAEFTNIKLLPLPYPVPPYDLHMHWHARFEHEPASRWIRSEMIEVIKPVVSAIAGASLCQAHV